ncbi:MAG: hypothetical protein LBK56_10320 [Gracilibacteraceae bacterium]|jgi:hypothetical protein|nr:hypothetical protein [Gracilibacteraceae bacterium]
MEIWNDLKAGLTGKAADIAYIVVHDYRAAAAPSSPPSSPGNIAAALSGGVPAPGGGTDPEDRYFRVQYNPNELQIYSVAHVLKKLDVTGGGQSGGERTSVDNPVAGRMDLSVSLLFDKMDPVTSFLMDKNILPTSASGIKAALSYEALLTGQEPESVQTEVEGFIAALRNSKTRRLTFYWADFSFGGVLNNVVAEYIMFSSDGLPARAKVSLRMRQDAGYPERGGWLDDFEAAFADDQSSLVRPEQRLSSVLNLKL